MKNHTDIEKVFVSASTLAQYVQNGLADDPTRSAQCKELAQELEKLIVNAENSKEFQLIADGFENMKVGLKQVAQGLTARDTSKADVKRELKPNHPVALGVGAFLDPKEVFEELVVSKGNTSEGRAYVKTTFRSPQMRKVRFTIWEDVTLDKRVLVGSNIMPPLPHGTFHIDLVHDLARLKITKIVPIGESKFNQNFDDITVKLVNI